MTCLTVALLMLVAGEQTFTASPSPGYREEHRSVVIVESLVEVPRVLKPSAHRIDLVLFGAQWCSSCQPFKPMICRLQRDGLLIYYNDVDQFPNMAKFYGVRVVPCWVLRVDDREVERHIGGGVDESAVRAWFRHAQRVLAGESEWDKRAAVPSATRTRGRSGSYYQARRSGGIF